MKHTPGPWKTRYGTIYSTVKKGNGSDTYSKPVEIRGSNAALIAAAPEMLEALESLLASSDSFGNTLDREAHGEAMSKSYRAIAKAKGE